ncbi:hypothetical protein F4677DRAFT_428385 [Hypoxylon crocopeplum]|nr:hypothetical protein F4677DRAFT_428385 [Hypoxylon crocopeplum]
MAEPPSHSAEKPPSSSGPPKVLSVGLARTGSSSIAAALRSLGYNRVHHGVDMSLEGYDTSWVDRATKASFPAMAAPGEPCPKPLTRADWDEVFGSFDAVTDYASLFPLELIKAYPEAKVILVHRDIDKWERSMNKVLIDKFWPRRTLSQACFDCLFWLTGVHLTLTNGIRQTLLGYFEAAGPDELRANLRSVYVRHSRDIQEAVPPGQLLCYNLGDGWEPLCKFLGKEVPEGVPFPHCNDAKAFEEVHDILVARKRRKAGWILIRNGIILAIVIGVVLQYRRSVTL